MDRGQKATGHILLPKEEGFSSLVRASLEDQIKYALRALILTRAGERPLYPELGSTVRELLFRPLVHGTKAEIRKAIEEAIMQGEKRVEITQVDLDTHRTDKSKIQVSLKYRVHSTRRVDQLSLTLAP